MVLVRSGLGLRFVLNVQVNGENVGYVESEQVFENAREDVQSRINTAKRMLQASGSAVEDTSWDVYPTYSLSIGNQTALVDGGKRLMEQAPILDERTGRTLVPLRFIAETLGHAVLWDGERRKITILK